MWGYQDKWVLELYIFLQGPGSVESPRNGSNWIMQLIFRIIQRRMSLIGTNRMIGSIFGRAK
jgi:hypothetical protein